MRTVIQSMARTLVSMLATFGLLYLGWSLYLLLIQSGWGDLFNAYTYIFMYGGWPIIAGSIVGELLYLVAKGMQRGTGYVLYALVGLLTGFTYFSLIGFNIIHFIGNEPHIVLLISLFSVVCASFFFWVRLGLDRRGWF
ncbi:hypothetical protein JCM19046_2847 [Bacillus sp. JCM 19046]|nr:hypothetical protein JCM19045_1645 [Bacillus sp. JCM 19045]GAF18282.1 hypothetical protein JCM19046_2847 [Bacillus sp. JCM 19046]